MNDFFARSMARATELTRNGNLHEATALIQAALNGGPANGVPQAAGAPSPQDVIEGEFSRLDPAGPAPTDRKAKRPARKPLAETLRTIAAGGMPARGPLARTGTSVPPGAEFMSLTHVSAHGRLDYRLYVPATKPGTRMPLIVMLHGCTQSPEDFAAGTGMNTLAEEFGCVIAYPAQPSGANAQKCWNWFRPQDQGRGQGEPALIAGLTADILRDLPVDPTRVYIAGLSAGAAAALVVAAAYPEVFSAVGAHSGLPAGSARDVPSAFSAMRSGGSGRPHPTGVPTIVFHGTADATVHPGNAAAVIAQAVDAVAGVKPRKETGQSAGGRAYRKTSYEKAGGPPVAELWEIDDAGHAWAGGMAAGSYTDPKGPDASREMIRFFLHHSQ